MKLGLALLALSLPVVARAASVELSHGVDALSGDRPGWRATALEALWTGARGAAGGFATRELSRFDRDDVEFAAFGQAPVGGFVLALEGSASPTWWFLPRWSAGLRVERAVAPGWIASVGVRAARYERDVTRSTPLFASAGLERYWGRWRAAATTATVGLAGTWSGTGRLALDLYYGNGGRVGVSAAAGRELESIGDGRLLRSNVLGAAIVGAHPLRGGWAATWELSAQRQGDLYVRTGGRLGLRRHF
ncbi:MAG TPA: YaiO family outer membrane beta-barrel protein [Anaeromyxobacter sp.]|nr:YaiO family outer membrane beta-barrel protein [Anaeromyxobacter sp.]